MKITKDGVTYELTWNDCYIIKDNIVIERATFHNDNFSARGNNFEHLHVMLGMLRDIGIYTGPINQHCQALVMMKDDILSIENEKIVFHGVDYLKGKPIHIKRVR